MSDESDHNKLPPVASSSGLQEMSQLIIEAIVQLTAVIELMHTRISPLSSLLPPDNDERASGVTGKVYRSIRSITESVGKGLDIPLAILSKTIGPRPLSASQYALVSALNGVLGDHLEKRQSSLAIQMAFKKQNQPLDIQSLAKSMAGSQGKLTLMIHGLCMNDRQWTQNTHNHGHKLHEELGHTVIDLHYNTGRAVSDNGKQLNLLLEALIVQLLSTDMAQKPELCIVAHSMGGLVARSAHHYAQTTNSVWPEHLQKLIFLGTPHHGAPLEKAGAWLDLLLGKHHYTAPLTRVSQFRSAGIVDLRHGNIFDNDLPPNCRAGATPDSGEALRLPEGVDCYTIATTWSGASGRVSEQVVGDGLVPLDSALGKHSCEAYSLSFKPHHQWVGKNISHLQLLSNQAVYQVIRRWLSDEAENGQ